MKVFIATPLPQTTLWDQIQQNYGIDTSDWSKFDGKHLIWNHPHLTCEDARALLEYGYDLFNSEEYVLRFIKKPTHRIIGQRGLPGIHNFLLSSVHTRLFRRNALPSYFFE